MYYSDITSPFIKGKIAETAWEDHEYIDDLKRLYKFSEKRPHGFVAAMHFHNLKHQYVEEYQEILLEVAPEKVDEEMAKLNDTRSQEEAEEELRKQKEDWVKAGGKVLDSHE